MSHAVVLVIGEDIDGQLAPYSESLEVEPYKARATISNDEWPGSFVAKEAPEVDLLDHAAVVAWLNARWGEEPSEQYHLDDEGVFQWSTYNPKSKWDWWTIGGRWAGSLLVKPTASAPAPNVSVNPFSAELAAQERKHFEPVMDGRHTDQARYGEIDWQGMALQRLADIDERWTGYLKVLDEQGPDAARREAHWTFGLEDDELELGRDAHLARIAEQNPLYWVQAVVAEGVWKEKGRLGWFGMSTDGPDERETWEHWLTGFLARTPADVLLTIVDYHI